jgi:hypothetical protein
LSAGRSNTTGTDNNFFGRCAGYSNTTGYDNVFIGNFAGWCNTTGIWNTFIGGGAGGQNITGCANNFFGHDAGGGNTTGAYNSFFGYYAGSTNTDGANNIAVGFSSGNDAVFTFAPGCSNRIVMGNDNHTNAYIKVAWTVTSDARDKTRIIPIPVSRELFMGLKPVQYNWASRTTGEITDAQPRYGFLAQDIAELEGLPRILVDDSDPENLKLRETMLIPVLVKQVQDLVTEVNTLRARIDQLEK